MTYANQYEEHLAHSAPCNSRWDGFDRGDTEWEVESGSKVIGRMTSEGGYKVEIIEFWHRGDTFFEVFVDSKRVHFTDDRAKAIVVGRWWLNGCPA
jgi:hypothetical protein